MPKKAAAAPVKKKAAPKKAASAPAGAAADVALDGVSPGAVIGGAEFRIGMSGWTYPGWRGDFYPAGLVQKHELAFASRKVNFIEINGTFYSLQKPESFARWYAETPANFVFAIKAPQFITHVLRLRDCEEPLATFLASGLFELKEKLGPILWQFPPHVTLKDDRFEVFAKLLPKTWGEAAECARGYNPARVKTPSLVVPPGLEKQRFRHVMEFRHPSFVNADFAQMLRARDVGIVHVDSGDPVPTIDQKTSDFFYARMHGQGPAHAQGYSEAAIRAFAQGLWERVKAGERRFFIAFNSECKERTPFEGQELLRILRETAGDRT